MNLTEFIYLLKEEALPSALKFLVNLRKCICWSYDGYHGVNQIIGEDYFYQYTSFQEFLVSYNPDPQALVEAPLDSSMDICSSSLYTLTKNISTIYIRIGALPKKTYICLNRVTYI